MLPNTNSGISTMQGAVSSTPGGAAVFRPLPPGSFPIDSDRAFRRGQEPAMQDDPTSIRNRHLARVAAVIVGIVIALAVGAPWLLNDAPPSPEAVVAAKVFGATAQARTAPDAPAKLPAAR